MKMSVTYEWLCSLVNDLDKKSPQEIGDALTNLGAETEEILLSDSQEFKNKSEYISSQEDVFEDAVYTLDIPSNRPDWLSVRGLAQSLALFFGLDYHNPQINTDSQNSADINIDIQSPLCNRYSITHIQNLPMHSSPLQLQKRLLLLGMRPINYLVDLTNFIMLETGQPLHAFDAQKIQGTITIRQAHDDEQFTLLNGEIVHLTNDDLIICDDTQILALAGIMGGLDSSVTEDTHAIYLESAHFDSLAIRRTAKRLGLKTESSFRFEKNISPLLVPIASSLFCNELTKCHIAQKELYPIPCTPYRITISPNEIRTYLGVNNISDEFIKQIIEGLNCTIAIDQKDNQKDWIIISYRHDLQLPVDIIEEIARYYGYDNIPPHTYRPSNIKLNPNKSFEEKLRPLLRGMGLSEAVTLAFRSAQQRQQFHLSHISPIPIMNPLNIEWTEMRTNLFDGLLEILMYNHKKAFQKNLAFSEIANIFRKEDNNFIEEKRLAFVLSNEKSPYSYGLNLLNNILAYSKIQNITYKPLDATQYPYLHPLNGFEIYTENQFLGFYGAVHPLIAEYCALSDKKEFPAPIICEISFDLLTTASTTQTQISPISTLPPIFRDITLTIPQNMLGMQLQTILKNRYPQLSEINFISVFQNDELIQLQKKNLSLQLIFESTETIQTEFIDNIINELLQEYKK